MASLKDYGQRKTRGQKDLTGAHSSVQQVTGASKADQADLQPGDIILAINGKNTADMLNVEAQNTIKNSKTQLQLVVERYAEMHHRLKGLCILDLLTFNAYSSKQLCAREYS